MMVIGLTGGIATGKSLISGFLKEKGAVIIDADELAKNAVIPKSPAWQEIYECFGKEYFDKEGNIDRKKLGKLVFSKPSAREKINSIIHPRVIRETEELLEHYRKEKMAKVVVVDAPLLIEAGMTGMVDEVWLVAVSPAIQLKRLRERDGISLSEAQQRVTSQMPLDDKLAYADRVIDNSGSQAETLKRVGDLWNSVN